MKAVEIFCCYARQDHDLLMKLKTHLVPLQRQGLITIWSDTDINASVEWEKELHQHLESANIILLLISPDFIASDYCYSVEMERAILRHNEGSARVIPILLRKTFCDNAPFAKLQMIPTNARPITNWPDRDEAFDDITRQINSVVSEIQTQTEFYQTKPAKYELIQHMKPRDVLLPSTRSKPTIQSFHPIPKYDTLPAGWWGTIYALCWSPDGSCLAFTSGWDTVDLWNPRKLERVTTLTSPYPQATSLTWSPDGSLLASASHEGPLRLWNLNTYEPRDIPSQCHRLAWSPDGSLLASSSYGNIDLWDINTYELITRWKNHSNVSMLAWSPDGSLLASAHGYEISFWSASTYERIMTVSVGAGAIAWSPNGSLLASGGSSDANVHLWDTNTYELITTLPSSKSNQNTYSLAWSPDNSTLASAGYGGAINIWSPVTYTLIATLPGDKQAVDVLAWSPDGSFLASAHNTVFLWHTM